MAVWSRVDEIKILADLNLVVRYRHTCYREILADFNLVVKALTTKFNSPAKFSGCTVYTTEVHFEYGCVSGHKCTECSLN